MARRATVDEQAQGGIGPTSPPGRACLRDGDPYVIPVFHIIHNNGFREDISDDQVHDAIRVMNGIATKRTQVA